MTESQILTLNERVKTISAYFANLSAALLAATAARMWIKGVDVVTLLWLAAVATLLLISWHMLYLLEATMEDAE